jgi:cadmium resistance protein CadD (predicted permease)
MSFRELGAWISLTSIVVVFGFYFAEVGAALRAGPVDPQAFLGQFVGSVVILVLVQIGLSVVAAIATRRSHEEQTSRDERERLIELKSNRAALAIIQIGAVLGAAAISLGAPAFVTANSLAFALVLSEVVRFAGQILYFRIGV